jgi:hypothetical protein
MNRSPVFPASARRPVLFCIEVPDERRGDRDPRQRMKKMKSSPELGGRRPALTEKPNVPKNANHMADAFPIGVPIGSLLLSAAAFVISCGSSSRLGDGDSGYNSAQDDARRPAGLACQGMADAPRELGETCTCTEECASGFCIDGVCCDSPCEHGCMICDIPGLLGACSPVPAGGRPVVDGTCMAEPVSSCGLDGTCDGRGNCQKYPDGTPCGQGTCAGDSIQGAKACQAGRCTEAAPVSCAPYSCNSAEATCFGVCTSDSQCSGRPCIERSCGPKPLGAACVSAPDCQSGFCAGGVCCDVACTGPCVSCRQPGKLGECTRMGSPCCSANADCAPPTTCISGQCRLKPLGAPCASNAQCASGKCVDGVCCNRNQCGECQNCKTGTCRNVISGGEDPDTCPNTLATNPCGKTGKCDGQGRCLARAAGVFCKTACDDNANKLTFTCDGQGACVQSSKTACRPYTCRDGNCLSRCVSNADCAGYQGVYCQDGSCRCVAISGCR